MKTVPKGVLSREAILITRATYRIWNSKKAPIKTISVIPRLRYQFTGFNFKVISLQLTIHQWFLQYHWSPQKGRNPLLSAGPTGGGHRPPPMSPGHYPNSANTFNVLVPLTRLSILFF